MLKRLCLLSLISFLSLNFFFQGIDFSILGEASKLGSVSKYSSLLFLPFIFWERERGNWNEEVWFQDSRNSHHSVESNHFPVKKKNPANLGRCRSSLWSLIFFCSGFIFCLYCYFLLFRVLPLKLNRHLHYAYVCT